MHYTLVYVSRKNFNISPFPASWTRYSAFSVIHDEKLCSRANGCEKFLSQTAVCLPQLIVEVKCMLMATLKVAIPKFGSRISPLRLR